MNNEAFEALRKIHLDEFGLSARSYAMLRQVGVDCVEDLMDCSIEDLKRIAEAIPFFEFKRQVED